MGFLIDHYDNFNPLDSQLLDLPGYHHLNETKPHPIQNESVYPVHRSRHKDNNNTWSTHSQFAVLSPSSSSNTDSPAASPYLSYTGEPWSPASVSPELDDDYSLASSTTSLSPNSELDTFLGEPENDDSFFSSPEVSPGADSIYQPLIEQYPSIPPHERHDYLLDDDDDLSPLTFSPPSLPLHLLSLSESSHQPDVKTSPIQPFNNYFSFDYDSSPSTISVPCSPSRRRSTTLPELEPTSSSSSYNSDLFGLHKSIPSSSDSPLPPLSPDVDMECPVTRWRSFPGCETDDDLIPMELASKNYIPDPSISIPTTTPSSSSSSSGSRKSSSLLLWDDDRSDMPPPPLSPSPENFYLDPSVLAECGDEELQQVYELRQRTAKSEKWERERCRELSALLRLKLDERGVLGIGGGGGTGGGGGGSGEDGDCSSDHHHSLSCCSDLPFSSSSPSSSDSPQQLTVYQPKRSSSLPTTLEYPHMHQQYYSQGPKHKIRSMSQLVASMLFHRQSDTLRRHPSRKTSGSSLDCTAATTTTTTSSSSASGFPPSSYHSHPSGSSSMGESVTAGGVKVLSKRRSRLSKVILPEELELDSEEEKGTGDDVREEDSLGLGDGSLDRSRSNLDLDEEVESSSRTVPELCESPK